MTNSVAERARAWLFESALPFWSEHGVDRVNGGFVERFDLDATQPYTDRKRIRVIGRQIYVFSHASLLGFERAADIARSGYEFLTTKAWLGPDRGWARVVSERGDVVDPTPDLYDCAFALFAFGWYYRASGDSNAIAWAHRTLDFLDRRMRSPKGGFLHASPPVGHRQQNPHMHLLESALALYAHTGEARFADLAREVAGLFREKFYDHESRTLAEFFDDDWRRAGGDAGRIIEPGHQFEWAWILVNVGRLLAENFTEEARGLVAFAETHGVDRRTGVSYMQVRDDGAPIDKSSRVWPNTERIKAAVALYEIDGVDPRPVFEQSGGVLLDRYLAREPRGTWYETFDAEGRLAADNVPASTFYHVFLAFSEMLRITETVK